MREPCERGCPEPAERCLLCLSVLVGHRHSRSCWHPRRAARRLAQFAMPRPTARSSNWPIPCNSTAPTAACWPSWNGSRPAWPTASGTRRSRPSGRSMENSEGKLLGVTESRFVSLERRLPDATGRLAARGPETLSQPGRSGGAEVVRGGRRPARPPAAGATSCDQAFASSWGDKALLALGEMALESGDFAAARWYWERILPAQPPPGVANTWPGYPDTTLDLAAVRARLVLVSILEGSADRAREELAAVRPACIRTPGAGWAAARSSTPRPWANLLPQSGLWPQPQPRRRLADVRRLAAAQHRSAPADGRGGRRGVAGAAAAAARRCRRSRRDPFRAWPKMPPRRSAIIRCWWAAGSSSTISGRFWPWTRPPASRPGATPQAAIYREALEGPAAPLVESARHARARPIHADRLRRPALRPHGLGRHQPAAAGRSRRPPAAWSCLDLAAEGKLLWKVPAEEGWALEGAPLAAAAAFTWPCGAATSGRRPTWPASTPPPAGSAGGGSCAGRKRPARGTIPQSTHSLLTLAGGTIYFNTNLGRGGGPRGRRRPTAVGEPVSPRPPRRPAASGSSLAARPEPVPGRSRHAAGRPGRQPAACSPWTPPRARSCGRPARKSRTSCTCWASSTIG